MNGNEDINGLLARHFAHEGLTPRQQSMLDSWIKANEEEYARLKRLMETPVATPDPAAFDAGAAWRKVEARIGGASLLRGMRHKALLIVSVAAALLLIVVLALPYLSGGRGSDVMQYANSGTVEQHIVLPDSSEVMLYPGATLAYSDKGADKVRTARLKGKAFFKVRKQHGASFKVETDVMNVVVMGTSFLVDAKGGGHAAVYVKTGRVKVTTGRASVVIETNEKAELINGRLRTGVIGSPATRFGDDDTDVSMVFSNEPVAKVVKEIESNTGIRIDLGAGVEDNFITTRIDGADGDEIVKELAFVCGCQYKTLVAGKHYILYK